MLVCWLRATSQDTVAIFGVLTLLATLLHPTGRDLFRSLSVSRLNRVMLALFIIAAVPLLPTLLGLASLVFRGVDSSLGPIWTLAAIAWGVVFVTVAELTQDAESPTLLGSSGSVSKGERG